MKNLIALQSLAAAPAMIVTCAGLILAIPPAVHAQDTAAAGSGLAADQVRLPEGVIIYARDVDHSVGAPFFPGQTHSVVTSPTNLIVDTLGNSLAPLTDGEIGSVSASVASPAQIVEATLTENLGGVSSSMGGAALSANGQQASIVGSAVSSGMSSLSSALGAMSAALGNDQ